MIGFRSPKLKKNWFSETTNEKMSEVIIVVELIAFMSTVFKMCVCGGGAVPPQSPNWAEDAPTALWFPRRC